MTADRHGVLIDGQAAILRLQVGVYGLDPILRAAHRFTDRAYVQVEQEGLDAVVRLRGRRSLDNLDALAGDFGNEVLDQTLRARIASETEPVRRLVVAQAFSAANLIRPELDTADPAADPARIGQADD